MEMAIQISARRRAYLCTYTNPSSASEMIGGRYASQMIFKSVTPNPSNGSLPERIWLAFSPCFNDYRPDLSSKKYVIELTTQSIKVPRFLCDS